MTYRSSLPANDLLAGNKVYWLMTSLPAVHLFNLLSTG
jgi:hypothetical protein